MFSGFSKMSDESTIDSVDGMLGSPKEAARVYPVGATEEEKKLIDATGITSLKEIADLKKTAGLGDMFKTYAKDANVMSFLQSMMEDFQRPDFDGMKDYEFPDPDEKYRKWDPIPPGPIRTVEPLPMPILTNPVEPKSWRQVQKEKELAEKAERKKRAAIDWASLEIGDSVEVHDVIMSGVRFSFQSWKKLNNVPNFDITFEKIGNKSYIVTRVS
jgi:hypothetical protein